MIELPTALRAYYARVGAEVLNFRRAMIRQYKGHYYHERALIKIDAEGEVTCSNVAYAPTKDEATAIKMEIAASNFPRAIEASQAGFDKWVSDKQLDLSCLYRFVSRATGGIIMVQERRMADDGRKMYIPHVFFSDGIWRSMEPDGKLPFWKPDARRSSRIMIHEGAKVAAFVEKISSHPWLAELREYEHWGAIGGALAPHRCNFEELTAERPTEVVYVCDNDAMGKNVLQIFSRFYGHAMKGIMFDARWPVSWDMADDMPQTMTVKGRFVGPSLKSLMRPATWATDMVKQDKGRPVAVLRKEFIDEWFHCVVPEVYVHVDSPNEIFTMSEFNNLVRPFSDVEDTARLVKTNAASKGAWLRYSPAAKPGIFMDHDVTCLNTHVPSDIKSENGDPSPFLKFMEHLIPNEKDRHEALRWCATLIARPKVKMLYGMLLISEIQGVGKSTLGEKILAPLMGPFNVSYPAETEVVESNFNYWAAHKRLAVVHEIYAGHSAKAYNKLKNLVTDKHIMINKKFQAAYQIENWVHIFACSNSVRALHMSMEDRRWFIPEVTEHKKPIEFWDQLNDWLDFAGGLGIIKHWAENFGDYVVRGEPAPWSAAKQEVVEEGYSPGMLLVAKFLNIIKEREPDKKIIIFDQELVTLIKNYLYEGRHSDRLEKPGTLRKVAKQMGWYVDKRKIDVRRLNMYNVRAISNDRELLDKEIEEKIERFLNVMEKAKDWDFGKN